VKKAKKKFKIPEMPLSGTDDEIERREQLLEKLKPTTNNKAFDEDSIKLSVTFKVDFNKEKK
jgi:hypothetical protein